MSAEETNGIDDMEMISDEEEAENEGAPKDDAEIIARAKKNWRIAMEAEEEIRKEALEDLKFRSGDQWPAEIKNQRDQDKRPCLTINRLPQFANQVINEIRQNRPAIKVSPTGGGARVETAEVLQGIIRHIEYQSNADIAYDTAVDGQVTQGFGYFRIVTEFANEKTFEQEIRIKRVRNPFSVYLDPSYHEPDGSDTNWAHVFDELTKDEFRALYPDSKMSQMADWESVGSNSEGWVTKDGCRITEYFEKTFKREKLYLLTNGECVLESELPETLPEGINLARDSKGHPVARETMVPEIKWYKLNGIEILERTDWPGKWIPIVPVLGHEMIIEGERIVEGLIRHARDSQRMYNFWASAETEAIALAPKAPWVGAKGQFEGHEEKWATANTRNHAFLEYNEVTSAGKPAPPPSRNIAEPAVQAITNARMASAEDLKATMGMYDASLGNRSNEQTGVAIQRRNAQAQTSNFHFSDNTNRSIRHGGRIMVDLIPKVYDTERAIRIIDEEDQQKMVWINRIFQEGGEDKIHKLDTGEYEATISTGPSFQTKREEAVSSMLDLVKSMPQQAPAIADLLVRNMDWPGAQEIADRLKKLLPPGLADDPSQQPIPPQAQAQLAQMQNVIKQLSQQNSQMADMIKTKKLELESKERIEYEKLLADMRLEVMRTDREHAQIAFKEEVAMIHKRLDMLPPIPIPNPGPNGAAGMTQPQANAGPSAA